MVFCTLALVYGASLLPLVTSASCPQIININRGINDDGNATCVSKAQIQQENAWLLSNLTEIVTLLDMDSIRQKLKPRDCQDIQTLGYNITGVYTIYPGTGRNAIRVRCDMDTAPGGWTVFQHRISNTDFYKSWNEYQIGFGDIGGNFWLGNQRIHLISTQAWYELRVDLTSLGDEHRYAKYQVFSVGDAESQYKLVVDGFSGTAGDSLSQHSGQKFSTKDRDNDPSSSNCAQLYLGGWWYNNCHYSNLNGDYGNTVYGKGPLWYTWLGHTQPLKATEMKMRRL